MKNQIFTFLILFSCNILAQTNTEPSQVKYPVVFIDNVKSDVKEMHKINPADIIEVMVYKGSDAINKIGPSGKDGVIYVETKSYVKKRNWKFLSSKSPEYAEVATLENAGEIQYILNGHLLNDNIEKTIGGLNDKNFRSLVVINKEELDKSYRIKDKKYGVIILSDPRHIN